MSKSNSIVIKPLKNSNGYWSELFEFRELFFFFAWRDILIRYKQSVIGILWALIRPFLIIVVFTFVFGRLAGLPSEGTAPYPLLVFAGILPWQLFSTAVLTGSLSLVNNAQMVSKIFIPKLIFPISTIVVAIVDFFIALFVYFLLIFFYDLTLDWRLLFLPILIIYTIIAAVSISLLLSALNLLYRDFNHIVPFLIQLGFFISPVGYSAKVIPDKWLLLYSLNPMVSIIDGFRWVLLGQDVTFYWPGILLSMLIISLLLWCSIKTFRAMESTMADFI